MGCQRTLFKPGLKVKENFLLRWKNILARVYQLMELSLRKKHAKELGANDFKASDGWLGR